MFVNRYDHNELRYAARDAARRATTKTLVQILTEPGNHPVEVYTATREELERRDVYMILMPDGSYSTYEELQREVNQ